MRRAFIFPGQGSQAVGMGRELAAAFPDARHVLEEVDEALKQKLTKLMFEGPDDELTLTENAQPALMAVSLAVLRVLETQGGLNMADAAAYVAGHSLGEYSALAAARSLKVDDCARLLKTRGRAMQRAVGVGEGAMAALLGLSLEDAIAAAEQAAENEVCAAANDNSDGQVVISGNKAAVERAIDIAKEKGAKRAMLLPVSAPFHCALMQPAADAMADALERVEIAAPVVPVVSNVTAAAVSDEETIRKLLIEQITGMVRWRESMLFLREQEVDTLVELGAGKVLSGLARRIDKEFSVSAIGEPADVEAFLESI